MRMFQRWARYQLRRRGYLDFLRARPPQAFRPNFGDLWFLYRVVRERKPAGILEFGSGCSTIIMAQALADNAAESGTSGSITSVDADPYWAVTAAKIMPPHLAKFCSIRHSRLREEESHGVPVFRHADLPAAAPDLLFLDGPSLTRERQVAADPLDIEEGFRPGFLMIVDGRDANVLFLRKYLKRHYAFTHHWLTSLSTFELI